MTKSSTATKRRSQNASGKTSRFWGLLFCVVLCCSHLMSGQRREPVLPDGEGKQLVAFACSQCHGLQETLILRDGQRGWEDTVDRMVLYGAQLSPSEADSVTRYLTTQLGPQTGPAPSDATTRSQSAPSNSVKITLPSGPGRELVSERCALCHSLEKAVATTRSKADWESITHDMVRRGMPATPDEVQLILSYLLANYSALQQAPQDRGESPQRLHFRTPDKPIVRLQELTATDILAAATHQPGSR